MAQHGGEGLYVHAVFLSQGGEGMPIGYTLYQRLKANADGNYAQSPTVSGQFVTQHFAAQAPAVSDYTKQYDGKATPLPLPSLPAGVQSMAVSYKGTANSGIPYVGSTPPVDVGT